MQIDSNWQDWLRLLQTKGIGNETARLLLKVFGLPEHIFRASQDQLERYVAQNIAFKLRQAVLPEFLLMLEKTQAWLKQDGHQILVLSDPAYPKILLEIADPPLMLYVAGRLELLDTPSIAVVGSRNASMQGRIQAEKFSKHLSQSGLCIISGLAAGIDAAAHQGGLSGIASTIAVIGTGADILYPARNRQLAQMIAREGCILSEYPIGTPAIASNFPRRNRLISGLSKAVLVVEAAAQSGSLITARMANEQGRDVFAIPGSILSPLSRGCHQLIKQGAKLVETVEDILEELDFVSAKLSAQIPQRMSDMEQRHRQIYASLLKMLAYNPLHFEVLLEHSKQDVGSLTTALLDCELSGLIERLPGDFYQRIQ